MYQVNIFFFLFRIQKIIFLLLFLLLRLLNQCVVLFRSFFLEIMIIIKIDASIFYRFPACKNQMHSLFLYVSSHTHRHTIDLCLNYGLLKTIPELITKNDERKHKSNRDCSCAPECPGVLFYFFLLCVIVMHGFCTNAYENLNLNN